MHLPRIRTVFRAATHESRPQGTKEMVSGGKVEDLTLKGPQLESMLRE